MTKTDKQKGCLSKTLIQFLEMNDEQKREKYGKNTAKYYERIVNSINNSFSDHKFAFEHLPAEYRSKISFMPNYIEMLSSHIENQWIKDAPEQVIIHTIQNLLALRNQFENTPLEQLAEKDFEKILGWLEYLKSTKMPVITKTELKRKEVDTFF